MAEEIGSYRASLCISSKTLSAQCITNKLEITPSESHEKGSPINKHTLGGKSRTISSWILDSELEKVTSLDAHIEHLISVVELGESKFRELSTDCKLEIYCGFFAGNEDDQGVLFLSSSLLKRLTSVPIDITVVLYPQTSE